MTQNKSKRSNKRGKTSRPYQNSIGGMMVAARNPVQTRRFVLSTQQFLGTTAGGVMSGAILMDPSGSAEWSSCALIYDQFRVLGGQLKIACMVPNSVIGSGVVRFAFDNDSTTTPTTYADVLPYSEVTDIPLLWSSGQIKTVDFRRPVLKGTPQEANIWYNETSPSSSPGALKYYGSGATGSTTYWNVIMDYLVEFQMRS